jgi:hypothetical protein
VFDLVFALFANKWYQSMVRDSIEKKIRVLVPVPPPRSSSCRRRRQFLSPSSRQIRRLQRVEFHQGESAAAHNRGVRRSSTHPPRRSFFNQNHFPFAVPNRRRLFPSTKACAGRCRRSCAGRVFLSTAGKGSYRGIPLNTARIQISNQNR